MPSHQFPILNWALSSSPNKMAFSFATLSAFSEISTPMPVASGYSLKRLNNIQPEPVPKSKIRLKGPMSSACSIKVSVSGRGSNTSGVTKN